MELGYYDEMERPEEDMPRSVYLMFRVLLAVVAIWDIVRAIPFRVADGFKQTFARY